MPLPPGQTTLGTIRATVRQRADMVNSQFVTDAELNGWINASAYELFDLLISQYGDDYFIAAPVTFVTDGQAQLYGLPNDFYKLAGVDLQIDAGSDQWVNVPKFNFADRNRMTSVSVVGPMYKGVMSYRLQDSNIWLTPLPQSGQTVRLWYVPRDTILVGDDDVLDGISGWEEYVIIDCVIKCLQKEESDTSAFMMQKSAIINRIESVASNRDIGNPQTVVDSQRANNGNINTPYGPWTYEGW